jgi:hypothetical protein
MGRDAGSDDDGMLAPLAAIGSPKEVALDLAGRFGAQVDRVGFYTPYLIAEETLGEMVTELLSS